ncbi:MAG: hypothetical protein KDC85_16960 [Saprospiraceae bacterium]|nr:hypothetical protein [Saprospiraceae bacterium]MCB9325576.1 hypothetical protein [Lewinellaceae bacterium]
MKKFTAGRTQITIYYNPRTRGGRQVLAYAQQTPHSILALDITKTSPTPTQWLKIAEKLKLDVQDLVLTEHPSFKKRYGESSLGKEDWLKVIKQNPDVIMQPIVIKGNDIHLVTTPSYILKLIDTFW